MRFRFSVLLLLAVVLAVFANASLSPQTVKPPLKKHHVKAKPKHPGPHTPNSPNPWVLVRPAPAKVGTDQEWLSYGHDDQLTEQVTSSKITATDVSRLTLRWKQPLGSWVVGSPLYVHEATGDILFLAAEDGTLTAYNPATGTTIWQQNLGIEATPDSSCGSYGISSTPVIDKKRGLIYAISGPGFLHAFTLTTGTEAAGFPVSLTSRPQYEYVWGGLRISDSKLLVPIASYCDQPDPQGFPADGRLVAVSLDQPSQQTVFDAVPGYGNMGGMWGYGGTSLAPDGSAIFTATGNGWVWPEGCTDRSCLEENVGYANSVVELNPDLTVAASNRPNVPDHVDDDFGAAPVVFQRPGCAPMIAANNKDGFLYVWDRSNITAGPIYQLGVSDSDAPLVGAPAWSPQLNTLYEAQARVPGDYNQPRKGLGVVALRVLPNCTITPTWSAATGDLNQVAPIVVNDVVFAGGGTNSLYALDALTGKQLWREDTGKNATATPIIEVNGTVFTVVGSELRAYSLPR